MLCLRGFELYSRWVPLSRGLLKAPSSTWKIISRGPRPGKMAGNLSHPGMKFEIQSSRKEGALDEMLFIILFLFACSLNDFKTHFKIFVLLELTLFNWMVAHLRVLFGRQGSFCLIEMTIKTSERMHCQSQTRLQWIFLQSNSRKQHDKHVSFQMLRTKLYRKNEKYRLIKKKDLNIWWEKTCERLVRWFQSESLSLQGVTKSPGSSQNQSGSRRNDTWSQLHLVFRSPCFQWGATRIGKFVRLGGFSSTNQGNFWPGLHRNCLRRDRWAIEKDIPSEVFMRTPEFHDNPECRVKHEASVRSLCHEARWF